MSSALVERSTPRVQPTPDRMPLLVGITTAVISVAAYLYFLNKGVVLGYKDSISHLQIAERVLTTEAKDAPAQFGGVWLPLQHILMLPFAWYDPFYYSGFAGSIISMFSYVATCVFLYKIVTDMTNSRISALIGVAVFALNPNILYMQSTAMGELLFFTTISATVYFLQVWIRSERYGFLFAAAFAAALGCLTRYEAWVLTVAFTAVVFIVAIRRHGRIYAEGKTIGFIALAWSSILAWIGWNWIILGDPLNFQSGEYAKPSLWVDANDPSIGSIVVAAKTYWFAVVHDFGILVLIATIVGAMTLFITRRNFDTLPVAALLVIVPFFVYSIESGQRPMNVIETSGNLYNLRFALILGLFAAICIGYLASKLPVMARVPALPLVAVGVASIAFGGVTEIITIKETSYGLQRTINIAPNDVSEFLRAEYDGGKILSESFGNETILFDARISLSNSIYEGSYRKWEPALASPTESDIEWIIMRGGNDATPDKVYQTLNGSSVLNDYVLAYQNDTYHVYKRK